MKPDPEKWFIGPDDESFEYYLALTRAIRAAKSVGYTENDREVKLLRGLQEDFQRTIIWQFYEMQDLDPADYGLPSIKEVCMHFPISASKEKVVDWALENWDERKAVNARRIEE